MVGDFLTGKIEQSIFLQFRTEMIDRDKFYAVIEQTLVKGIDYWYLFDNLDLCDIDLSNKINSLK